MDHDRRTFLKTTGFAGAVAVTGAAALTVAKQAVAQTRADSSQFDPYPAFVK